MKQANSQGKWALVTGASNGLGVDFARNLAGRGCHVILVARREERLRAVQQEITEQYGVQVDVIAMDLEPADAPQRLYNQLKAAGRAVDVLINNAGFGLYGAEPMPGCVLGPRPAGSRWRAIDGKMDLPAWIDSIAIVTRCEQT